MRWPADRQVRGASRVLAAVVLAATLVAVGAAPAHAAGATVTAAQPATVSPCDALSPLLQPACRLAEHRAGLPGARGADPSAPVGVPGGGLVGGLVGGAVESAGDAATRALTRFVVDGAVWLLEQLAEVVTRSTSVSVTSAWYAERYRLMAALAASFALLFLLLQAGSALLHQDPLRIGRAVAMVAAAGLGTGAALAITQLLLTVSDQLSEIVARGMAGDLRQALTGAARGLTAVGSLTTPGPAPGAGVPLFAALLGGLVTAVAAAVIWIELLLREVAIYATLLFFPIGLAGLAWDGSRRWARRLAELLAALIFAKFVIVAILSLAASGLASGGEGFAGVLAGVALLVVAAFAPFLLLRLVTVLDATVAANDLDGTRQRGTRPLLYGGQMAFNALQRHRIHGASRAGGITVASAGGLWPGAAALAADAATHGPHLRPPAPPPPQGSRDRPDEPPHAKGA
jgi:hypothetical protein